MRKKPYVIILYWLTRTEPIPDGERDAAHRLGQRRFDYFIEQVARKIGAEEGLTARVFSNGNHASLASSPEDSKGCQD